MIVDETADRFRFVTQPDHAALAGAFAENWGAGPFRRPDPYAAVVMAAYNHDDGWWPYDRRPHLGEDGDPIDFRHMPAETWIDLYDDGIEAVVGMDPYAGLLVSMHGSGLRRRRYGLSPDWPDTPAAFEDFVDRQEDRQSLLLDRLRDGDRYAHLGADDAELLSALHATGSPPEGAGGRLWDDYRLLQAWDALSLSFCTTASPPAYGSIESVPTDDEGADETLSIDHLGGDEFRVAPYPFATAPLVATVPSRTVRKGAFDGDDSLVRAYYGAGRETETIVLRR